MLPISMIGKCNPQEYEDTSFSCLYLPLKLDLVDMPELIKDLAADIQKSPDNYFRDIAYYNFVMRFFLYKC